MCKRLDIPFQLSIFLRTCYILMSVIGKKLYRVTSDGWHIRWVQGCMVVWIINMLGTREAFYSPLKLLEMMKWSCRISWSKSPLARSAVILISCWAWVHPGVGGERPTEHTHRWWGRASHGSKPSTIVDSFVRLLYTLLVGWVTRLIVCLSVTWFLLFTLVQIRRYRDRVLR